MMRIADRKSHFLRAARISLVAAWLASVVWAAVPSVSLGAQAAGGVLKDGGLKDGGAGSGRRADLGEITEQLSQAVRRRKELESLLAERRIGRAGSRELDAMRNELAMLKYLEATWIQREEAQEYAGELAKSARIWKEKLHELRLAGPEESRPYSIFTLDEATDRLTAERHRLRSLKFELATSKELEQATQKMQVESERKRRRLKEELEAESDSRRRVRLQEALHLAEMEAEAHRAAAGLRRQEIANGGRAIEIAELKVTFFREKRAIISRDTVFSREHLNKVIRELDRYEAELRAALPVLEVRLRKQEAQAERALAEFKERGGVPAELGREIEESYRRAREARQTQAGLIQRRLRDLSIARAAWQLRFEVSNGDRSIDQMHGWREQARLFAERIKASRQFLEDRSRTLVTELGLKEKQARLLREASPEAAEWVRFQIGIMQNLSQTYASHLSNVESLLRTLDKLESALARETEPKSAADWVREAWASVRGVWNYELISIDDRPITVRKILIGLGLLLVGFLIAKWISRMIGRRVLPRLGLNSGVSAALQSIAFYAMVTSVTFVSLELINIPLTIFTFLGGAVAIGIGFGSQNILNNFISGLILLAEQPIRVGDLVDIDGVCGMVENIGARSTRVKTGANLEIIVPNSKFLEDNVTNWTLSDARVRTSVTVGVAYGSPTVEVAALLKEAVGDTVGALENPEPIVIFEDFGDNALSFEVHFWIVMPTEIRARQIESEVRHSIARKLEQAGIAIAFPQRDVHLDTAAPIEVNVRHLAEQSGLELRRRASA